MFANWTSRLPRLQAYYGMDNGDTGLLLTMVAFGALVAMPLAGVAIVRGGSRRLTIWSTVAFVATVPLLGAFPSYWMVLLVAPVIGLANGAMDVAMNAQAVEVEKDWGSPITSSFHACFSAGMFLGAATAAGFIALGFDFLAHTVTVTVAMLLLSAVVLPHLYHDENTGGAESEGSSFRLNRLIVLLGIAALFTMIAEGSMADWTPLYLTRVAGSSEALAPVGQASFAGAMFAGRAFGDALRNHLGSMTVVRGGGLLALVGVLLAVFYPEPLPAIIGFGMVGLGLANIIPVVFSAASKVPGLKPGVGISSVSTIGYAAFLLGPPLIGFVSDHQNGLPADGGWFPGVEGLRVGLGVVALLLVLLMVLVVAFMDDRDTSDGN